MVKMIIAEDEYIVRKGIASIPWAYYGIEITGSVENGYEALELIKKSGTDILLTDIRMPLMDGLELVKMVKNDFPKIKSILLTGYKDFDYAKAAINACVIEYILKPSTPEEIIEAVLKAKALVEVELSKQSNEEEMNFQYKKNINKLNDKFFLDLLYGRFVNEEDLHNGWISLTHGFENFLLMTIDLSNNQAENEEMTDEQYILLDELCESLKIEMHNDIDFRYVGVTPSRICLILEVSKFDDNDVKYNIKHLAERMNHILLKEHNIFSSIGISKKSNTVKNLCKLFSQTLNCLNMKFFLGNGCIVHIDDIVDTYDQNFYMPVDKIDNVIENVKTGNISNLESSVCQLLNDLAEVSRSDQKVMKDICINLIILSLKLMADAKVQNYEFVSSLNFYEVINKCTTIAELLEKATDILTKIIEAINSNTHTNKITKEILAFIEQNYMNYISLVMAANHVHLSSIYLSRLLKKELNQTFVDLLTSTRISKACLLLKNPDIKTYEVSNSVGIKDPRYFTQIFRKYCGVTPTEYRNSVISVKNHNKKGIFLNDQKDF